MNQQRLKRKGFMVRKEPKGRGGRKHLSTRNRRDFFGRGWKNSRKEDVITTGGSAIKAGK